MIAIKWSLIVAGIKWQNDHQTNKVPRSLADQLIKWSLVTVKRPTYGRFLAVAGRVSQVVAPHRAVYMLKSSVNEKVVVSLRWSLVTVVARLWFYCTSSSPLFRASHDVLLLRRVRA